MSNNKQSSVEWSIDQMIALCEDYDDGKINYTDYSNGVKEVKSQAKAMHKEEIIITWHKGYDNLSPMIDEDNCGDKYYKKTFGGNNEQQ